MIDLASVGRASCRGVVFDFASLFQFIRTWITGVPLTPRRLLVIVVFCLVFPLFEAVIWMGLFLDDLFFPGHRRQEVRAPVFIVGNFRSGTTFLHRLMAKDTRHFTTMRMWEILFAPSLTMSRVIGFVITVQRAAGGLLNRWMAGVETGWQEKNITHRVSLAEPEEDDYLLLHIFSTLTVGLASGLTGLARRYARFDQAMTPDDRKRIMTFYKDCLRRHLHGAEESGLRYLAKNPALTPKLKTVFEHFPDAKIIILVRQPEEMLASTASMMGMTWEAVGAGRIDETRREFLIDTAAHWHHYPLQLALEKGRAVLVKYEDLVADPAGTVRLIYDKLEFPLNDDFAEILAEEAVKAAGFKSRHRHTLGEAGIDPVRIAQMFGG
jgi:hypothetical protein